MALGHYRQLQIIATPCMQLATKILRIMEYINRCILTAAAHISIASQLIFTCRPYIASYYNLCKFKRMHAWLVYMSIRHWSWQRSGSYIYSHLTKQLASMGKSSSSSSIFKTRPVSIFMTPSFCCHLDLCHAWFI